MYEREVKLTVNHYDDSIAGGGANLSWKFSWWNILDETRLNLGDVSDRDNSVRIAICEKKTAVN